MFTVASMFINVDTKTKKSAEPIIPILLLTITDISIIALISLAFVGLVYTNKYYLTRKRVILTWALAFFVIIVLIGIASAGGWYLMTQGASPTDADETITIIKSSESKAVVVDTRGASTEAINAMKACAQDLLKSANLRDAEYYIIEPDRCLVGGQTKTPEECENEVDSIPNIYMVYNRDETKRGYFFNSIKGSITVSGEADIFKKCELFYVFNVE